MHCQEMPRRGEWNLQLNIQARKCRDMSSKNNHDIASNSHLNLKDEF